MTDSAPTVPVDLVAPIRQASRRLVRELGFMRSTLAGTDLSPSAVHALVEIGARDGLASGALCQLLMLEKSSVSRMVRKLVAAGLLRERGGADDGRVKLLALTAAGRRTLAGIDRFARRQVVGALAQMPHGAAPLVAQGLARYADALEAARTGRGTETPATAGPAIAILPGYRSGAIGRAAEMHGRHYGRTAGFGSFFEAQVATGVAEFTGRLGHPRNQWWTALRAEAIVGTVAIDGQDLAAGSAHLRWFIVDDGVRGAGVGRRLLAEALGFCDAQGFADTQLWTFRGLDAARHLYEAHGFVLAEERAGRQWGSAVMEQRFVRLAGAA